MDTLTIKGVTYLSSKHAAKVTGYAKDYVGQLCREGRVQAQLVGRNWYVSEQSIREHRFGPDNKNDSSHTKSNVKEKTSEHIPKTVENTQARYTIEKPVHLSHPETKVDVPPTKVQKKEEKSHHLDAMQQAWQEWFVKLHNGAIHSVSHKSEKRESTGFDVEAGDIATADTTPYQSTVNAINHSIPVKRMRQVEHTTKSVGMSIASTKVFPEPASIQKNPLEYGFSQEKISDAYRGKTASWRRVAHVLNVVLMLTALVAVVLIAMNFVYKSNGNLFEAVTGTTVYTAK